MASTQLRKGRTKSILMGSVDSALLAVEIYNKPRTTFRTEGFISMMIIAWTKLFHAWFNYQIGDRYYYKTKSGTRYKRVDGEKKAWELKTCIKEYNKLEDEPLKETVVANLHFFIGLRNKIEHRHVDKDEIDSLVFGECQSFLYNYESLLIKLFGREYALNENLVYSLQFSTLRTKEQQQSNRRALSREVKEIKEYVDKYRTSLSDEVFASQEYSIKLIQIPKVSNTNRSDLAIEFVRLDELSEEDKEKYEQVTTIIKDRVVKTEAVNVNKYRPSDVLEKVNEKLGTDLNHYDHRCLYTVFSIRPNSQDPKEDPFDTNTDYCMYDEVHGDYVFTKTWIDFLSHNFDSGAIERDEIRDAFRANERWDIDEYKIENDTQVGV